MVIKKIWYRSSIRERTPLNGCCFFKNKNKENYHDDVIYNYILGQIIKGVLLIKLCLEVRIIFTLKAYIDVDLSPKKFY